MHNTYHNSNVHDTQSIVHITPKIHNNIHTILHILTTPKSKLKSPKPQNVENNMSAATVHAT